MSQIPRRSRLDKMSMGERAIFDATQVVEGMGAHPWLTEAVVLLGKAREKVADYVDASDRRNRGIDLSPGNS